MEKLTMCPDSFTRGCRDRMDFCMVTYANKEYKIALFEWVNVCRILQCLKHSTFWRQNVKHFTASEVSQ